MLEYSACRGACGLAGLTNCLDAACIAVSWSSITCMDVICDICLLNLDIRTGQVSCEGSAHILGHTRH